MIRFTLLFLIFPLQLLAQSFTKEEINRWEQQATQVTIIRDPFGIPHIYGKTDADAVFGLLYAQCEDDFKRVEMNYVEKLGRLAEVKGASELYNDLLIRLLIDSSEAITDYQHSPSWLTKLLNAYADGINFFLYKHPSITPALLQRFQPWYPLLWTDGSISAINTGDITAGELKEFYGGGAEPVSSNLKEEEALSSGSNGFAVAPSKASSGHALLYINPHVSFYFRSEVHLSSEEGLNSYGAVTWGQFFVYQGFNEHCGWMHTSSNADVADMYAEKIVKKGNQFFYEYDKALKPVREKTIVLHFLGEKGLQSKNITSYFTHHGPVMANRNGQWLAVKANNRSMKGLIQSWQRTKTRDLDEYKKNMELVSNTSNNTVFADDKGNIAYWHGNFMPKRDPKYDWAKPVDGSISATEWKGLYQVNETVHIYNPASGWIQNCNSTPFTVAGTSSPRRENYPRYMAPDGQNFRALNAAKLLEQNDHYTIDKLIATGYDTHLWAFDILLPSLITSWRKDQMDSAYQPLKEPMEIIMQWSRNADASSIATTLAIEWGQHLLPLIAKFKGGEPEADQVEKTKRFADIASSHELLEPLLRTVQDLTRRYGRWNLSWGEVNRYQRLSGDLTETFDDKQSSLPVGFAASTWGCLPSFVSRVFPGVSKRYGYKGNSFICAVEFGKKITSSL